MVYQKWAKRKIWKRTRKDILNDKLEYETTVTAKACKLHGSKFEDSIPWALKYEASVERNLVYKLPCGLYAEQRKLQRW